MNILVIQDNPVSRNSMRAALEAEGHRILEAADGKTGLELMAKEKPDLVLEDLLLPDVNGFDLASQLRALPGATNVPIVALTGLLTKADELKMAAAPFTEYLFKPVQPARLVATIMERMRNIGSLSSIPVIVITARDARINREQAIQAGARAFFHKPPDGEDLLKAVRDARQRARSG